MPAAKAPLGGRSNYAGSRSLRSENQYIGAPVLDALGLACGFAIVAMDSSGPYAGGTNSL